MSVQQARLVSLIEFSKQSARMRGKPVSAVAAHGVFALHEHEIRDLPGIRINVNGSESEDEIWMTIERLHESAPPEPASPWVKPWVQMTQAPIEEPRLREAISGADMIAAGTHCSSLNAPEQGKSAVEPAATIALTEYANAALVRASFATYLSAQWRPWAAEEKQRRKTIRLYSQLFTLKQKLEGSIVEAQLELLWGVGLGVWRCGGVIVSYPLIGRLVEMSLNAVTAEMEIRPRDVDARVELDWYGSIDNPGVASLEREAKEFFRTAATTFSPFDRGTFEPLLHAAVTNLDANGVFWPNEVPAEDRTLPKADDTLKITDTWVLFARPRTNNLFIQDLEKLLEKVEASDTYPPAVAAVVTDPDTANPAVELPPFRGVSASYHSDTTAAGTKARDLYFPKPFNDEQVRIVQLLEISDGVVAQGPPGTGKTHTIANVICHYLAEGKRVLVTSMKDPALAVLQEQLPSEIRPLAIALLTNEQEGMKQFEHAIHKIASEIQTLDRKATSRAIAEHEERIDALHGKLADTDRKIGTWAKRNLSKISIDETEIDPQDAAREVLQNLGQFEWIPDSLGVGDAFTPQFSDADIVSLRAARRALGQDIDYLNSPLPQLVELPDSRALLEIHQDLAQFERLKQSVDNGTVPALSDSSEETIVLAQLLLTQIEALVSLRGEVSRQKRSWTLTIRERLRSGSDDRVLRMLEALGGDLEKAEELRRTFLARPVATPTGMELDAELVEAVRNLSGGKRPFGLRGLLGKTGKKRELDCIRVLGSAPIEAMDWQYVEKCLALSKRLRELAVRWNALAHELQLDSVPSDHPDGGLAAASAYALYLRVKAVVKAETEICAAAYRVFPNWPDARRVADDEQRLVELDKALRHHLTKNRLANVWAAKERFQKLLVGRSGRIIEGLRVFIAETLGNPDVDDADMQAQWSTLMTELSRVLGLAGDLDTVRQVCDKITASGARAYAVALRQPLLGTADSLLPDNWRSAWRLKRIASHLDSADAQDELKKLARVRHDFEIDLARAYQDIVVKRTWLKLAENASPSIRAALQAYLNAIQKIGKGTGKRAIRYRQDARTAAAQANPAVPCWIMPHYRVSESLPAELGCFDLLIIDEASQSDLTALPSLLRARKVLIVGDDKQVSPEGVGLEEQKILSLMSRFLANQVETYRPQMSPERSIYDLFKVVFATSAVMLKEHFRCVGPIIEYSKREFYNHELRPLRIPKASERLDPPLIDVLVQDGHRRADVNLPEARFIVDEITAIVTDPRMSGRSIGVVSLLGDKQAMLIWDRLTDEIGPEVMQRHRIACGDARTFQGKERDIMFLSMVTSPNDGGAPLSRDTFAQRFNVAASRAKDRMYLVRSVEPDQLSEKDLLRRGLIAHFAAPFAQDEARVQDLRLRCESPFERDMYDALTRRGYWVTPQVQVGQYRIDMVVEGHNDARLAIECDGDKYHGADKWADDMHRQRVLERAGWVFWRCFASAFIRRQREVLVDLLITLAERGIEPIGAEGAPRSVHTEQRLVSYSIEAAGNGRMVAAPESVGEEAPQIPSGAPKLF